MIAGNVIVIPTPTADPCIAAMVGLRHLWIARATRPPLNPSVERKPSSDLFDLPVTMVHHPLVASTESNIKVCARTKCLTSACQNNHFHSAVHVEHWKKLLKILDHLPSESILMFWAVQRDHNYWSNCWCAWRMMGDGYMAGRLNFFIRCRQFDRIRIEYHGFLFTDSKVYPERLSPQHTYTLLGY